jgi:fibronectin-binding autotransporter adhesin
MKLIRVDGLDERGRIARLLSTTMLIGLASAAPIADGCAQTIVDQGTLVVSSDNQLGGDSVTVDNSANLDATLQINAGVHLGNEILVNNLGTLSNAGTISRGDDGAIAVTSEGGGAIVTNLATGTIEANGVDGQAIAMGGAITVTNAGTIQALGAGGRAVYLFADQGESLSLDNQATGNITGTGTGVQFNGTGTVTNSGVIAATAADGLGVYFGTVAGFLINRDGGHITGVQGGAMFEGGGSVTNTGAGSSISASASDGIGVFIIGSGTVSNTTGDITGGLNGVRIWGDGTVTNTGGSIRATADDQGHGVEIVDGLGTVTNLGGGTISGKLFGVSFANGGTISNTASSIIADGTDPVAAGVGISGGLGTVTNTGQGALIKGPSAGVRLVNGGTVINGAGATIQGVASIEAIDGNTTLSNAGALIGNVQLRSASNNKVTLFNGSSITGNLVIGTNASSTLTLDGTGSQLYSQAVSGTTTFSTGALVKQGIGTWTLDRVMTRSGATQVNAGTLAVANNGGLGSGAVTVNNSGNLGATLAINAGISIGNDIVVNNGGTFNNAGTVARTSSAVRSTAGVATVNNTGTLRATGASSIGIQINGGAGTITNTGQNSTISGVGFGVRLANGGAVTNTAGTISASAFGSAGVLAASGSTDVINSGGGLIQGVNYGVILTGGGSITNGAGSEIRGTQSIGAMATTTLVNAGTLTGGVNLNFNAQNSAHLVTLLTGSSIAGALSIGNNSAARLTLDGAGNQLYSQAVTGATSFAGTLVKQGLGTWTLDQTQNGLTTGAARVEAGTLRVDTQLASATVDVLSGATLAGSGTLAGAVTVANAGHLSLRSGATLSAASLVLNASSNLDVALGLPSDTRLLSLSGDLTLDGKLNVSALAGFGRGAYRLIDYNGALTDNGLDLASLPMGYQAGDMTVQTSVLNQVNLVVGESSGNLRFWNGSVLQADGTIHGGNGTWNAADTNWTTADGQASQSWAHDFGIFSATGGTVTVNGAQRFSGLQFTADGYSLVNGVNARLTAVNDSHGTAVIRVDQGVMARIGVGIDGSGTLDKRDAGTLVLSGTNSYTGGTRISAGVLQVAADANLGASAGGLTFAGGALATTASFDIGRTMMLTSAGRFDIAANTELGLTGTLSGAGDLIKSGAGTLRLDNVANAYGNTLVTDGALVGNASSISGNIGNAASVIFEQASNGRFVGDIGGLNGVSGQMIKRGAGTLALAGNSTLDWSIEGGGLSSSAERFSGNAAIGANGTLTLDQANSASYAGVLSGTGRFIKAGAGRLIYDGNSAGFAGVSTITAGALVVGSEAAHANAVFGGSMSVQDGGTLAGHGTVGSGAGSVVTIASGGTLSPGYSIGKITINGNLVVDGGGRFVVEVDPGSTTSDLVHVTGTATLNGGSVAHIGNAGSYQLRSTYRILTADQGLSGRFTGVSSSFAFLDPTLSYDANNAYLRLDRNNVAFVSAALTRNQIAAGGAIDSIGFNAGNPVYDAIVRLPDGKSLIRGAFDQLSGEIHASAKSALIEDSRFIRDAATDRIRAAFDAVGAERSPVMSFASSGAVAAPADSEGLAAWGYGFGAWGAADSDGNAARLAHSTSGFLIGVDTPVFDSWRFGALAGYSRTNFKASDRLSSGSSDNYHLGLYGGTQWGALGLRTGLAYTWHDLDITRSVAFPGFSDSLRSNYRAGTFQAFSDFGYRIDTAVASFEPFARLAYVNLNTGGFAEQGGAAALHAGSQTTGVTFTTLGLRASASLVLAGIATTARGTLGWRHAFGDTSPLSTQAFSAGNAFTVAGVPIAKNSVLVEAGLDMALTGSATLGLSYTGQIASSARQHSIKANLNVRF